MGCLSCAWCLTKFVLFCLLITFLPGIPPNAEYKEYSVVRPKSLDASLLAKQHLNNAEHVLEGAITGPEAFVLYNGAVYTGIHGGWVVRLDEGEMVPVVKFGKECEDITEEHICGRPLGLKVDTVGNLYVADSYYGVFKYNIPRAEKTLLVDANEEIDGKKSTFINDVAVAKDGTVYFTVSSTTFPLYEGVHALLATGDGRIIKFDPQSKKKTVLAEGLLCPNGIALSPNDDYLVFSESTGARVMRYNLKGAKKGVLEVFAEGLPGLPDNIREDGQGSFFVSLVMPADETHPALPIVLGSFPNVRKFLGRVLYLLELPFVQINKLYPNFFCRQAAHAIGHFSSTRALVPDGVIILHLDSQGQIKDALVGTDGTISHVSDMIIAGDYILLASPYNNYIGRVPRPNAPNQIHVKSVRFEEATPEEKRQDEAAARKAEEEAKLRKAREEQAKKAAENAAKAKKAAEEASRKAAEEASRKAAEEARLKKEAEARKAAEESKARLAAEAARKRAAEEAKAKRVAEENAKKAAEAAKARKAAEESARKAAEEVKAKKLAEEAKARKAVEEAKARKAAEELKLKKAAEESANRKAAEEAKAKRATGSN